MFKIIPLNDFVLFSTSPARLFNSYGLLAESSFGLYCEKTSKNMLNKMDALREEILHISISEIIKKVIL